MLGKVEAEAAATGIDLEKAKADYDRDGYCIIPNVLSEREVIAVRQRIVEQAAAEKALGWAREDAGIAQQKRLLEDQEALLRISASEVSKGGINQRISMLVNKGKILRDLVTHPVALELAEHALGHNFLLSAFSANIAKKGGALDGLHRDAWWCPMPYRDGDTYTKVGDRKRNTAEPDGAPAGINIPAAACSMVWMLTDFTEENGATRIVPGSHLLPDNADSSVPHKVPTIAATGRAGSCMFFDGRLWHGTGQNVTDESRIGLFSYYCGPQFRQLENFFLALDPSIANEASERLMDLLGYKTWFSYGTADTVSPRDRLRGREPWIPELRINT